MNNEQAFLIKSCTLTAIATGEYANSISTLCDKLATVHEDCIYHHFWGGRLFAQFTHPEYHNDFAIWAHRVLHDEKLAEKLSILDPTEYVSLNGLRADLIEILEQNCDDYGYMSIIKKNEAFHFVRSEIIIFDTPFSIADPKDIPQIITALSPGSIFFHFIDARSRTAQRCDDFSSWLMTYGDQYSHLIEKLRAIDPYFLSLSALKNEVVKVMMKSLYI